MADNHQITSSAHSMSLGIPILNEYESLVATDGSLKSGIIASSYRSSLQAIKDRLLTLISRVRTQQAEISEFDQSLFVKELVEQTEQISKSLEYLEREISTLGQSFAELEASKYLVRVQSLSPSFINGWNFTVDATPINYTISADNEGYNDAFLRAREWFLSPERQAFRDLDILLNDKEHFVMFEQMVYCGLISAWYAESTVDLPVGTFACPIRFDQSPEHNVLLILDITIRNIIPEPATEFFCGQIWSTLPNAMDILQQFESNVHQQFDGLRNLLRRLAILEKQITLQICHFCTRASVEALHQSMRVLLVAPHVPSMEVINKLLNCPQGRVLFPHLSALHRYQNFKVHKCKLRRDSI